MKQIQDITYIISQSQTRAEAIRQVIDLRGVDDILTMPYDSAASQLHKKEPALIIFDVESDFAPVLSLLPQVSSGIKCILLADTFDEEAFVASYDQGVRDFLVKPVPNAMLVSTLIRLLQERRQQFLIAQKDHILEEMGVLSANTGTFTTSYLIRLLEAEFSRWQKQNNDSFCMLVLQINGLEPNLPEITRQEIRVQVARIIKDFARDSDLVGELFASRFAVLLPHTAIRGARTLAKRLITQIQQTHFKAPQGPLDIQVQAGIANAAGCIHYEALLERTLEDLQHQPGPTNPNIHMI